MATNENVLNYILDQLSPLEEVTQRQMMGGTILYYRGKNFGGLYQDRLLVKPTKTAYALLPDALLVPRVPNGKNRMLLVEEVDNRELLCRLVSGMYDDLPPAKPKKAERGGKSSDK